MLRAVQPADIESIRQWRNAQMDVLRQSTLITPEAQEKYFAEKVWPQQCLFQPEQILLAIENNGNFVGYGGLVHMSWRDRRAEVSFLLDPSIECECQKRAEIFKKYLRLLQELAFSDLSLIRLWTETYSHRTEHIHTLESVGFRLEGRLRNHIALNSGFVDAEIHGLLLTDWRNNHEK